MFLLAPARAGRCRGHTIERGKLGYRWSFLAPGRAGRTRPGGLGTGPSAAGCRDFPSVDRAGPSSEMASAAWGREALYVRGLGKVAARRQAGVAAEWRALRREAAVSLPADSLGPGARPRGRDQAPDGSGLGRRGQRAVGTPIDTPALTREGTGGICGLGVDELWSLVGLGWGGDVRPGVDRASLRAGSDAMVTLPSSLWGGRLESAVGICRPCGPTPASGFWGRRPCRGFWC